MRKNEKGEILVEHHTHYEEIDGYDRTIWITASEHKLLHNQLRKEGKEKVQGRKKRKICAAASNRTTKIKKGKEKWREDNPEKVLKYAREWREKHPDRVKEGKKKREEAHKTYMREYNKKHYKENQEKEKIRAQKNRDKKKGK